MILLERPNAPFLDQIVCCVNEYIDSIPNRPDIMLLPNDYFSGHGPRIWRIGNKGYYNILRLFDHAQVDVTFVGFKISDIITNIFEQQISFYYPYANIGPSVPYPEQKKIFQNYCHQFVHPPKAVPSYDMSADMIEIYIPHFIEQNMNGNEHIDSNLIQEFSSGIYFGHQMCYDKRLGFLYIIPTLHGNFNVYRMGMSKNEALNNIMKIAHKDKMHLPWKW